MSTKRRGAAAASPDMRLRGQKRRKVSEANPVSPDEADQTPSPEASAEAEEQAEDEGDSAAPEEDKEPEEDFEGDSIQTAQDKIMAELLRLKDDDGEDVAYPFIGKPDRNLYRDYYEVIHHPTSLRTIQKQVRGTDSRKNPTRTTAFPTWKSFEDEVEYIWRNAREYNEDGSDISNLAGILEEHFKKRVAEAKKHVPDSKQTSETPAKVEEDTPTGAYVGDTSNKQQANTARTHSTSQQTDAHRTSPRHQSLRRNIASPSKSNATITPSSADQPSETSAMPKAAFNRVNSEVAGQAPQPSETANAPHGGDNAPSETHETPGLAAAPPLVPFNALESIVRRPGEDARSALIRNVHVFTHESLNLNHSFNVHFPASDTLTQHSMTITLPATHHLVSIKPTVMPSSEQRHVKLVARVGMQRLHQSANDPTGMTFDLPLPPGLTTVHLEAIAGPERGVARIGPSGSDIDYERVTIFFQLLQ
ncbi:Bromo domain-containing protein [Penicillium ucsense]|uniref:Bromo domain-containing protein n=1 Tax=Penicillium ucsense TaxID=2839758 RepID=A0A8J8VWY6_9EURO|nr:Bromo domain-containing protein [Penicillium ucsense]KAF7731137.1 Bromo domain-containing protein [Penicillium ucsense]